MGDFQLTAVRSLDFQRSIEKICNKRNDKWSKSVEDRIKSVTDLIARYQGHIGKFQHVFKPIQKIMKHHARVNPLMKR